MALHSGGGELLWRGCIAFECDHLRAGHLLRVVYLRDASLPSVGERVNARDVFLVGKDLWSVSLLRWALRSREFRRTDALCFRGRVHGSGCQVAEDATRGSPGEAMLSSHGRIYLLLFLLWSSVSTVSGRVGNEQ